MENFFGTFYKDVVKRIKESATGIRFIEMDLGQMDYDVRPGLAYPACLIDFPVAIYTDLEGSEQECEVRLTLKLCFAVFSSANGNAPDEVKNKALECYKIEQQVAECLQGWHPAYCSKLRRKSVVTLERYNEMGMRVRYNQSGTRVRMITFSTLRIKN